MRLCLTLEWTKDIDPRFLSFFPIFIPNPRCSKLVKCSIFEQYIEMIGHMPDPWSWPFILILDFNPWSCSLVHKYLTRAKRWQRWWAIWCEEQQSMQLSLWWTQEQCRYWHPSGSVLEENCAFGTKIGTTLYSDRLKLIVIIISWVAMIVLLVQLWWIW